MYQTAGHTHEAAPKTASSHATKITAATRRGANSRTVGPNKSVEIPTNNSEKTNKQTGRNLTVRGVLVIFLKKSNEIFTNLNEKALTSLST